MARKWLAGPYISDAIRASERLNRKHVKALINYLGEEYHKKENVDDAVGQYLELVKEIRKKNINAEITIKPTQIGLLLGKRVFAANYGRILELARKNHVFVWFDMEESWSVTDTIRVFASEMGKGGTGLCIQTYLERSMGDVKALAKRNAIIRLVKGAHKVPERGGFKTREETTQNFLKVMEYMFRHCGEFTVGSHDSTIIDRALALNKKYKKHVTYAMLTGVRNDYAFELAKRGERVSIYVTYGQHWVAYTYRRLKEINNLKLIVRSIFGG